MRYFAHRNKRPFYYVVRTDDSYTKYSDCWISQDDKGDCELISVKLGTIQINYDNYRALLDHLDKEGVEVSGIGDLMIIPEELRLDEGL